MTRLTSIATAYTRPRTTAELSSILSSHPWRPCPICRSAIYAILHSGDVICAGCDWERAMGPGCAIPVTLWTDPVTGQISAQDLREARRIIEDERSRGEACSDLPGCQAVDAGGAATSGPAAGQTIDEWWESLPIGEIPRRKK